MLNAPFTVSVCVEVTVPAVVKLPLSVAVLVTRLWDCVSRAPEFTMTAPGVTATFTVTALSPVVAMMAVSAVPGVFAGVPLPPVHPVHVPVAFQLPPVAVEVQVTAKAWV